MSTLSSNVWAKRHAVVIVCTALLLPIISFVGIIADSGGDVLGLRVLVVALFLVLASSPRFDERNRSVLAVAGALTAGSALVGASGGNFLAHLIFPFIASIATMYRRLSTILLSVSYLIAYYGFFGLFVPETIYNTDLYLFDYGLFSFSVVAVSLAASGVGVASWLLDTGAAKENLALSTALADAALRQSQATELHDNVIQSLSVAKYALDDGDFQVSLDSIAQALETTKGLVGSLLTVEGADLTHLMSITSKSDNVDVSKAESNTSVADNTKASEQL